MVTRAVTQGAGVRGRLSKEQIRDIADRINIRDVVADYVTLRKAGVSYKGLCPFHQEKTPSFTVHPGRQTFHCFGCGEGGDVFSFLQKINGLTFIEAVDDVAQRAGVELPRGDFSPEDRQKARVRTSLYDVNEVAAECYARALQGPDGHEARAYLERRGMPPATIERFRLGLAPDAWEHLVNVLARRRIDPNKAESVGLVRQGNRGGHYDFFRDRLMIPIIDNRQKVVAFGGRTLGDDDRKYINSPESPIYDKSTTLYGLAQAHSAIRREDQAIVVEGYFDCLSLVAGGIENVVATCGTALTAGHLRLLKRYTRTIVLVYDADEAGFKAACRSLDTFLDEELWPMFVAIPDGKDPDDFVRAHGGEAFAELVDRAVPLIDRYLSDIVLRYRGKPAAAERVLEAVAPTLSRLKPITAQPYWAWLADELRLDEKMMKAHVRGLRRPRAASPAPQPSRVVSARESFPQVEGALLELLVQQPEITIPSVVQHQTADMMLSRPLAEMVHYILRESADGRAVRTVELLDRAEDESLRKLLTDVSVSESKVNEEQVERLRDELLVKIHRTHIVRQMDEWGQVARTSKDRDEQLRATQEIFRLKNELMTLDKKV